MLCPSFCLSIPTDKDKEDLQPTSFLQQLLLLGERHLLVDAVVPHVGRVQRGLVVHVLCHHGHPVGQTLHWIRHDLLGPRRDDHHSHYHSWSLSLPLVPGVAKVFLSPECRHQRLQLQPQEFLPGASTLPTRPAPSSGGLSCYYYYCCCCCCCCCCYRHDYHH